MHRGGMMVGMRHSVHDGIFCWPAKDSVMDIKERRNVSADVHDKPMM
jgi:hypothetical protein